MEHGRRDMPLPLAFALALLLHVGAVLLFAPQLVTGGAPLAFADAALRPDALHPDERERDDLTLGIDAPTPSSMTWIGHDVFLEHLARLSEVEQAEFDVDPGAMAGDDAPLLEAEAEPVAESTEQEPTAEDRSAASIDPTVPTESPDVRDAQDPPPLMLDQPESSDPSPVADPDRTESISLAGADEVPPTLVGPPAPPTEGGTTVVQPVRRLDPDEVESIAAALLPGITDQRPRPRRVDEPVTTDTESEPQPPTPEEAVAEPDAADEAREPTASERTAQSPSPRTTERSGSARQGEGEQSDRESTATSTIEVPLSDLRAGRPVAAHGLEIRTRNPVFPILTSVTAAPRNPLVEIRFGRDGRPRHAGLLESSGDSRVDGPIVDSLYRWRASGAALEPLDPDDPTSVVRVMMRIIVRNR